MEQPEFDLCVEVVGWEADIYKSMLQCGLRDFQKQKTRDAAVKSSPVTHTCLNLCRRVNDGSHSH